MLLHVLCSCARCPRVCKQPHPQSASSAVDLDASDAVFTRRCGDTCRCGDRQLSATVFLNRSSSLWCPPLSDSTPLALQSSSLFLLVLAASCAHLHLLACFYSIIRVRSLVGALPTHAFLGGAPLYSAPSANAAPRRPLNARPVFVPNAQLPHLTGPPPQLSTVISFINHPVLFTMPARRRTALAPLDCHLSPVCALSHCSRVATHWALAFYH